MHLLYLAALDRLVSNVPIELAKHIASTSTIIMKFISEKEIVFLFRSAESTWLSRISAVYCIFCLYHAQPNDSKIKIRIGTEHQLALLEAIREFRRLESEKKDYQNNEAIDLCKRLYKTRSFVPGASETLDKNLSYEYQKGKQSRMPGVGVLGLPFGLRGQDAALLREVKYHIDTCLLSLGTGNLEGFCREYRETLGDLWSSFGQGNDTGEDSEGRVLMQKRKKTYKEPPLFVADLDVGHYIHEYCKLKEAEVKNVLSSKKVRVSGIKSKKKTNEKEKRVSLFKESDRSRLIDSDDSKKQSRIASRRLEAQTQIQIPKGAKAAVARDAARQMDMENRAKPWAKHMGVEGNFVRAQPAYDSEEDMPGIPGIESAWEDLAGPSTLVLNENDELEGQVEQLDYNDQATAGDTTVEGSFLDSLPTGDREESVYM